ncbi:OmpA/MotB family protein [Candidatus Epulonipiscium viviparus]|uniref:OmpA/MotB family protein n=1 Tax=Candidatus Epulonipiscium viviparus TaxID=420336 RepID=UPI0027380407|nr:OmpA family protein [Candidatus Epulopiscium viviparus]
MAILRSTDDVTADTADTVLFDSAIHDLMAGLMIIFILISIGFMARINDQSTDEQSKVIASYELVKSEINDDLMRAFGDQLEMLNMEITSGSTIRFDSPEVLFETGQAALNDTFKNILDKFFPIYLDLIYNNYKEVIKEIRIEGHTSTEWGNQIDVNKAYFNNMELSQDRTREVLEYVINLPSSAPYRDWLIANMTANGLSSSRPIIDPKTGLEDHIKSRRVEFKIVTNW